MGYDLDRSFEGIVSGQCTHQTKFNVRDHQLEFFVFQSTGTEAEAICFIFLAMVVTKVACSRSSSFSIHRFICLCKSLLRMLSGTLELHLTGDERRVKEEPCFS